MLYCLVLYWRFYGIRCAYLVLSELCRAVVKLGEEAGGDVHYRKDGLVVRSGTLKGEKEGRKVGEEWAGEGKRRRGNQEEEINGRGVGEERLCTL